MVWRVERRGDYDVLFEYHVILLMFDVAGVGVSIVLRNVVGPCRCPFHP